MNVLQLISSSLGYYGTENVVVTLSKTLQAMGTGVVVSAFRNTAKAIHIEVHDEAAASGLKTELIDCEGRLDRRAIRRLGSIVERHEIDVIHCHGIKPDLYALLAIAPRVGMISTCHTWTFDSPKEWLIAALERSMLRRFDRVVAVADHIVPQLRRFGVRAQVIYNGIDLAPFHESRDDCRRTMNWGNRPVIAAVGRLAPQKGLQFLLRAVPTVLASEPSTLFVLIGDGPEEQFLKREAQTLGIERSVSFMGVRKDIPQLLAGIDILAMPSLDEGLPMALLEAMGFW